MGSSFLIPSPLAYPMYGFYPDRPTAQQNKSSAAPEPGNWPTTRSKDAPTPVHHPACPQADGEP
ncbi:MAG: hypothetical protein ABI625_26115 [bacterium]